MGYFRAIAADLDGTLAYHDEVDPEVLEALRELRARGIRAVLVTGRILAELREVFPTLEREFDLVVAENGGVVAGPAGVRELAPPVEPELAVGLSRQDVPVRLGRVILACGHGCEQFVGEELRRSGYEYQVIRNRGASMVVPAGVNKGTGVVEGLGDLGISRHSTVALGDAENDHSLLAACEMGVAMADAVATLKRQADLVLEEPGPAGVVDFLRSPVLTGRERFHSPRWRFQPGTCDGDGPFEIPASQVNLLISGGTTSGKSYLAGYVAEELVGLGYTVVVLDWEGDHSNLGRLRGVLDFHADRLPRPDDLPELLAHRFSSVVLDLSLQAGDRKEVYARRALRKLVENRADSGLPHWIVVDEAHHLLHDAELVELLLSSPVRGVVLVTWRPADLPQESCERIDFLAALPGREAGSGGTPEAMARFTGEEPDAMATRLDQVEPGTFLFLPRNAPDGIRTCRIGERQTSHIRHWRKYADAPLPLGRGFVFRSTPEGEDGPEAANLRDFVRMLGRAGDEDVLYHADRSDFSRWIRGTVQDAWLASVVASVEEEVRAAHDPATGRQQIIASVRYRYGT